MLVNIFLRARKKEPCQRRISFKTINQIKILQTYNGCRFCPWEFFWGRKSISEKTLQISRNLSLAYELSPTQIRGFGTESFSKRLLPTGLLSAEKLDPGPFLKILRLGRRRGMAEKWGNLCSRGSAFFPTSGEGRGSNSFRHPLSAAATTPLCGEKFPPAQSAKSR